ncbi:MAG: hypothetical protein KDA77_09145 [Planctomycetaceae bacterium]|nr:hypothetical protein [Planctomycetaceae bacterium]
MTFKMRTLPCLILICLMSTACSSRPADQPELGEVAGIVTLDGKPLDGVLVQFTPAEGRGSQGLTDGDGKYELMYAYPTPGAKVGNHSVTFVTPSEDDSDPEARKVTEIVPERYRVKSDLTADVKAGENQIHFDLTTK